MPSNFENLAHPESAEAVTPVDGTNLTNPGTLFVGTGGDLNVILVEDTAPVLFRNVADGSFFPLQVIQVLATSTTASDIVVVY